MTDVPTFALLHELKNRMERYLYDNELDRYDDLLLTDMPNEDTMGMYFAIEEYMMAYLELIEMRRHEQG